MDDHYFEERLTRSATELHMVKRKKDMPKHEFDLFDNSIERVINATISILEHLPVANLNEHMREDIDVNLDDWHNLKETVTYWWNEARNEMFKKHNNKVLISNNFVGAEDLIADETDTNSLSIVVKRHIELLAKLSLIGEPYVYYKLMQYISDATKEHMVVLSNAQEIWDIFADKSGKVPSDNTSKVQVSKIRHVIQEALK